MKLEGVASYLQTKGLGTVAQTIFVNFMSDEVKNGILLVSPLQGTPIDHELPGYRRGGFQVIVRADNYAAGESKAVAVSNALTIYEDKISIPNMAIKFIRPKHDPVVFPRLTGGGLEFSINFDAYYVII